MKIVQISDTHLSHRGGITNDNFVRIARFINDELRPDLIVHTGDVSILSPDVAADRETARELMGLIQAPLRVLPGNHDVGEPGKTPWGGFAATSERTDAFTAVFGADHWLDDVAGYAVIGFNTEILSTGTPQEDTQWQWLEKLAGDVADRPALVFGHKPVWPPLPDEGEQAMAIPASTRDRLLAALAPITVVAYGSGHLHHFATGQHGDAITVSAPSTAFVVKGHEALTGPGLAQLGVVEYRGNGTGIEAFFRSVPDLVEGSPLDDDAFNLALAEIGVTVTI